MSRTPKKPIYVTYVLPSLIVGGIERQFVRQMHALDKAEVSPQLVTLFEYPGRPNLYEELPSMPVVRLDGKGLISGIKKIFKLKKIIKELNSDIVVSSMFSGNIAAGITSRWCCIPHIPREHNTYEEKRWYHHVLDRLISKWAYVVVAVSNVVADFAVKAASISREKITVIGNGIEIKEVSDEQDKNIREKTRVRLGIPFNETVFINVARLKKAKNQAALIDAFSNVYKQNQDCRLLLVGDGNERPAIDQKIKSLGLEKSVLRLGHRDDVFDLYRASDVFVLPSYREGFPNVVLEAMSCGLPVILTQGIGGQSELVQDGNQGYVCNTDSVSIEAALKRFLETSEESKNTMRQKALETASGYSIEKIVGAYVDLFKKATQ